MDSIASSIEGSNAHGGKCTVCSIEIDTPSSRAIRSAAARTSAAIASSVGASALRRSMLSSTRPGITLREFGDTTMRPPVPRA